MDNIDLLLGQAITLAVGRANTGVLYHPEVADASINVLLGIDRFLDLVTDASFGTISVVNNYVERNEVENAWIYEYTAAANMTTAEDADILSRSDTVEGDGDVQTDDDSR
jgi:hypothetical protein